MTKKVLLSFVGSLLVGLNCVQAENILCIADTPETRNMTYHNGPGAFMYVYDYFLSPGSTLSPLHDVNQKGWMEAKTALSDAFDYDAVILWDMPAGIRDGRQTDPLYSDLQILTDEICELLVNYVKNGGVLYINGGTTCYGGDHDWLGSADYNKDNVRSYTGYHTTPLMDILPVEFADTTLNALNASVQKLPAGSSVTEGLDFRAWGVKAFHKVKAKPGAEILLQSSDGQPLLVRSSLGKGQVICMLAAPKANKLVQRSTPVRNPAWNGTPILLNRLLRSAWGKPEKEERHEAALLSNMANAWDSKAKPESVRQTEFPYGTHVLNSCFPHDLGKLGYAYFADMHFNLLAMQSTPKDPEKLASFLETLHQTAVGIQSGRLSSCGRSCTPARTGCTN